MLYYVTRYNIRAPLEVLDLYGLGAPREPREDLRGEAFQEIELFVYRLLLITEVLLFQR